jgi:hypothetical protein
VCVVRIRSTLRFIAAADYKVNAFFHRRVFTRRLAYRIEVLTVLTVRPVASLAALAVAFASYGTTLTTVPMPLGSTEWFVT